jgi:hypothetical protein
MVPQLFVRKFGSLAHLHVWFSMKALGPRLSFWVPTPNEASVAASQTQTQTPYKQKHPTWSYKQQQ